MKNNLYISVLFIFLSIGFLQIASASDTELWASKAPPATAAETEAMEIYYRATKLCKPLGSHTYEGTRDALGTKTTAMIHYYWEGLTDFAGNPFLATEETREFLRSPGYGWAMKECFGDSTYLQNAFYASILALDRAGYLTKWIITGRVMSATVQAFAASRFALAHPTMTSLALKGLKISRVLTYAIQGAQVMKSVYENRQHKKQIEELLHGSDRISQDELDSSLQIVRDRIAELEIEIAATDDPAEKAKLEGKKAILDQIILESSLEKTANPENSPNSPQQQVQVAP